MRRTFKIMLIAGVIAAIGGVIYMAGEALWDKDNAVGPRPARRLHRRYRLLKPLAVHYAYGGIHRFSGRAGDRGAAFARGRNP